MDETSIRTVVVVSAGQEWDVVRERVAHDGMRASPYGEWCTVPVTVEGRTETVIFFHEGWGKIAAASATQYGIDRWRPQLIVNLGTCGGFEGVIARGDVVLAERTLVYDIIEQMGDPAAALAHYTTDLDLSWLAEPYPLPVHRGLLLSGDRDLLAEEVPVLRARFGAAAGDWESGAIAYVTARNGVRCLILRGVTDLVGSGGGEAYDGSVAFFRTQARIIMTRLLNALPGWLACVNWKLEAG
ncbi:MAG TPA: 5'-methylthioadenosine/S-adenosylhomocysteine nucleosidase [Anaerolineae bacterium]|nr:5'-methylthioadenosine/S-adenosylhomocysteine nucleosidase [Anaerolineae bacterium]HQH38297.1 5'-methylthioadenosine/S-adenosylhomocysteine nucleosidase [Anaerolineae bacterium]